MEQEKVYYIYHIPGKKIGATSNLKQRVEKQQGYKEGEYEILDQSTDVVYISEKEISLQQMFGYKVDETPYKELQLKNVKEFNMKVNITDQTTTFPFPIHKLKAKLLQHIGAEWQHPEFGSFVFNLSSVEWIVSNAITSQFSTDRCFVYNKALADAMNASIDVSFDNVFDSIRLWAKDRGIYEKGDAKTQYIKLLEEAGELAQALLKDDQPEVKDAIGDMIVVLTNLAELRGLSVEDCIESAYEVIAKRTGKMENGTFKKDTL